MRLLLASLALSLCACSAKKESEQQSSRGTTVIPGNYKLAECNRMSFSWSLDGHVSSHYDASSGQYRSDYINVNITTLPAQMYVDDRYQIYFLRWEYSDASGTKTVNTIPTRFYFMDKLTGQTTLSNNTTYDRINFTNLKKVKTFFGSNWLNVPLSQIFDRTMIVLQGVNYSHQAVSLNLIDTSANSAVVAQGNVLLPPFLADPNLYKTKEPYPELYNLHPNISLVGSGGTEDDYFQRTEAICQEMSFGRRIPASVANTQMESRWMQIWTLFKASVASLLNNLFGL